MWDAIWFNANLITLDAPTGYGIIENSAIAVENGKIVHIGDIPQDNIMNLARNAYDCGGKWITPALIDCHTHLVYVGNRAHEFELRLQGASYEEIAQKGGGILSTVKATRDADENTLYAVALARLDILRREGIAGIEIKSGYGLDLDSERKMLRVATRLRDETGLRVQRSFLGAHAFPPEYKNRADDYIAMLCDEMIPALHAENLIDAVDGFCETIAFSPQQIERVFQKASDLGLPVKLHAEQLSNQRGAILAAQYKALSADHLEYLDVEGAVKMAEAGTVAVLLPGAYYFLRETQRPPIDALRAHHVPIALASDHNPGSSPVYSLLLMMNMACTFFRMTPEEALRGVTAHAAKALGWNDMGVLKRGHYGGLCVWDVQSPAELSYAVARNPLDITLSAPLAMAAAIASGKS